ncbi:unnamed protein product [Cylindrotheca closterium]|uniref:Vezatin n=1 Tax=Cylindrotheca closterium TaxID=2856 RepID=A0AAD2FVY8_9STRA|nr:unnamed protein product [Cylindrotheca closterium]
MDDQLELHMQRCLENEDDSSNDQDSDLQQLLALQSSRHTTSHKETAKTSSVVNQVGESSSIDEKEDSKPSQEQRQESSDNTIRPQSPKLPLDPRLDCHMIPSNKAQEPPFTNVTQRFLWWIAQLVDSQFESHGGVIVITVLGFLVVASIFHWDWDFRWSASTGFLIMMIITQQKQISDNDDNYKIMVGTSRHITSDNNAGRSGNVDQKKLLEETKEKVSHLLGLAGAPPPLWPLDLDQSTRSHDNGHATVDGTNVEVKTKEDNNQQENVAEADLSTVLPSLVHCVESHVQFLLTIDQSLDYLRTSASIHLGLGPQSQCVERVEQAAMAREFRCRKRQQTKTNNPSEYNEKKSHRGLLKPQRGPSKSVLSLVTLRRNLAKAMIHQSGTLQAFWKHLYEHQESSDVESEDGYPEVKEPLLEMPHIVNLAWIKDARHVLAKSLSGTVEEIILLLQSSSSKDKRLFHTSKIRFWLDDSDVQTRQLTHYLRGMLLLPNEGIVGAVELSAVRSVENPNDPLFHTLLNFRTQLDALGAALWSCQQYCNSSNDQNMIADAILDKVPDGVLNGDLNLEEDSSLSQKEWWSKIQQISKTCRAFENEISQIYFPQEVDLDESDNESDDMNDNAQRPASQETGDYVHGEIKSDRQDVQGGLKKDKPTKTKVFTGKGNVEDRPKKTGRKGKGRTGTGNEGVDSDFYLPQRDTVSELAMVSELQNRIKALVQDEEIEEDESDSEDQKAARLARAPTAPLFLGASGSLLAELKQSIPSMGVLGSEIGNDGNEEIIGED